MRGPEMGQQVGFIRGGARKRTRLDLVSYWPPVSLEGHEGVSRRAACATRRRLSRQPAETDKQVAGTSPTCEPPTLGRTGRRSGRRRGPGRRPAAMAGQQVVGPAAVRPPETTKRRTTSGRIISHFPRSRGKEERLGPGQRAAPAPSARGATKKWIESAGADAITLSAPTTCCLLSNLAQLDHNGPPSRRSQPTIKRPRPLVVQRPSEIQFAEHAGRGPLVGGGEKWRGRKWAGGRRPSSGGKLSFCSIEALRGRPLNSCAFPSPRPPVGMSPPIGLASSTLTARGPLPAAHSAAGGALLGGGHLSLRRRLRAGRPALVALLSHELIIIRLVVRWALCF